LIAPGGGALGRRPAIVFEYEEGRLRAGRGSTQLLAT
jgi:hypothetical protein